MKDEKAKASSSETPFVLHHSQPMWNVNNEQCGNHRPLSGSLPDENMVSCLCGWFLCPLRLFQAEVEQCTLDPCRLQRTQHLSFIMSLFWCYEWKMEWGCESRGISCTTTRSDLAPLALSWRCHDVPLNVSPLQLLTFYEEQSKFKRCSTPSLSVGCVEFYVFSFFFLFFKLNWILLLAEIFVFLFIK